MSACGHFFAGFMGVVISRLGGATSYGISEIVQGLLALITPYCVTTNIYLFMVNRFLAGFLGVNIY